MIHIGIDTSNYKTSLAAVGDNGGILANISEYLDVPKGERGLRQSDSFFKHSNRLPELAEKLFSEINIEDIATISASYAPRRVEGSYMPCFLAGVNMAKLGSQMLGARYYQFSHQEGHAAAIMKTASDYSEKMVSDSSDEPAIFMHLSGGTTEFLICKSNENGYDMKIVGGSLDISFGQLLDRFGVALGFHFPSGEYIDRLASEHSSDVECGIMPRIGLKEGYFNLSGAETRLLHFAKSNPETKDIAAISREIMQGISDLLIKSCDYLSEKYNINSIYMAGGVASSESLRQIIKGRIKNGDYRIIFGDKALSGDNAVGIALLGREAYSKDRGLR
ncbi:MAG: hypothetical protein IKE52_03730 [Mogibacterium sp.]|nr:hypothetical protein [Mogibacterium sp.]